MYCRECNYDLRGKDEGECPECGAEFEKDRPDTYFDEPTPKYGIRIFIRAVSDFLGFAVFLFCIWLLPNIQWYVIDVWLDTHTNVWLDPNRQNHRAWWVPVGPGKWLLPLQLIMFLLMAILSGLIVRQFIRRRFLPEFH